MKLPENKDIKKIFKYHRICVLKVYLLLIQKVISEKTCCLYKLADSIEGNTKFDSKYKRLLRFFTIKCSYNFCLCSGILIISLILNFPFNSKDIYLAMDRTNWKIGAFNINPLFLGLILPNKIFIPLIWIPLEKRGNSNQIERINLLKQFLNLWSLQIDDKQMVLLADREFIGDKWLKWLKEKKISFVIRLRENMYFNNLAEILKRDKYQIEKYIIKKTRKDGSFVIPIEINGEALYYVATENKRQEGVEKFCCFITDRNDTEWTKQAYEQRWNIEVFFKHIKTNGFNLEDMNLKEIDKVRLIISVVSVAYVLCLKEGIIQNEIKPIKLKKDFKTDKTWKSVSLFRLGIRYLKQNFKELDFMINNIIQQINKNVIINQEFIKKSTIPILKSV